MKYKYYDQLDVFRALAALSVCAVHFNYNSIFYNYFAQGLFVQLFFTLSGFVIYLNYNNNLKNFNNFFIFIKKRFKRLYPLHLFFLIIFLLIEFLKLYLFHFYEINLNNKPFEYNNFTNFILNLFFLQHFAEYYNFNSPSWSISVEMMLYCSFSFLIFFHKKIFIPFSIIYIVWFIIVGNHFYGSDLSITAYYSGLYSFLLGCVFCHFMKQNFFLKNYFLNIIYYLFLFLFLLEIFFFKYLNDYIFTYSIIFGIFFLFSCSLNKKFFLYRYIFNSYFKFLGKISYSIYLSHLFIFFVLNNFLKYIIKLDLSKNENGSIVLDISTFEANFYTIIAYVITIIFSKYSYQFIELKFYKK